MSSVSQFFVVGIGASAGGLRALQEFFENMPADSGAAFVVIQHLSPDFKSLMKELLERRTRMAVHRVTEGMELEPNSVYLIPPKNNLVVKNRQLHLINREDLITRADNPFFRLNFPIDLFFHSLAADCGERAIGVVLSGTGSDGSQGLEAIDKAGGIVLVQSPSTAEFDGMPQSAIATGSVDQVLSPPELAETIYEITHASTAYDQSDEHPENQIEPSKLRQIASILTKSEDIDFSYYKASTLSRRIYRRCSMAGFNHLTDYIYHLQQSSEEQKLLRDDLLIGVTSFFRDPQAWNYLETNVLPRLVEQAEAGGEIRIWVTACSTGEEAYSMAILLDEAIQKGEKQLKAKIFATDIDSAALEKASAGIYPENIADRISPERLERYFKFQERSFQVARRLREMLIFAPHNLLKNAGFSKMNLVSCRNVLIYMQNQLQQQVLRMLHFSLAPKGILFLGAAETLGDLEEEFEPLEGKWKIFEKRREVRLSLIPRDAALISRKHSSSLKIDPNKPRLDPMLALAFESFLKERRATCALVNRENHLLHLFGDEAKLIQVPQGRVNWEITTMVPKALQLPLNTALHRARREGEPVLYTGIKLGKGDEVRSIDLKVTYYEAERLATDFLMVVLEEEVKSPSAHSAQRFELDVEAEQRILELEYELQQTRENLQATIEELETTNEEQQATNEELLASNEELQSTNEELHSVNEELYTVNAEYQSKIQELTELNNDMDNLLRSTGIGVVFLDSNLKVRKFTPAATAAFNLVETDIGRPLAHLSHNLECPNLDCPNLVTLLRKAMETQQPIEQEVKIVKTGDHLLMRVNSYRNEENQFDGLVLTLIGINHLKKVQQELERQRAELEYLYETIPVGLTLLDKDLKYLKINDLLAQINGIPAEEHIGKTLGEVLPELAERLEPIYRRVFDTGEPIHNVEIHGTTPAAPNVERDWIASYYSVELGGRRVIGTVVNDVTEFKRTQHALKESQERLDLALLSTGIGTWSWDPEKDCIIWDKHIHKLYGVQPDQLPLTYQGWLQRVHPEDREKVEKKIIAALEEDRPYEVEFRILCPDGSIRFLAARAKVERDRQGRPSRMIGTNIDMTESERAKAALQFSEERLRQIIDLLPYPIFAKDADGRFILANQATADICGTSVEQLLDKLHTEVDLNRDWVEQKLAQDRQVIETGKRLVLPEEIVTNAAGDQQVFQTIKTPMQVSEYDKPAVLSIAVDITERKQAEEALRKRAFYDPLTGLPNRDLFIERLKHAMKRSSRQHSAMFAVLFLDLDSFKEINDSMGHLVGDQLLRSVAQRLQTCVRPGDTVSRLGGDEFAILLEAIADEQNALTVAARIHKEKSTPFEIEGKRVFTSTSIGIALYVPELSQGESVSTLLENADMAMYRAKELGSGQTQVFTPGMRSQAEVVMGMKTELREALEREEFELYYQPIIRLQTGRLTGLETLVRWNHPDRGLVNPAEFLPIAERSQMLQTLERWILEHACLQFQEWLSELGDRGELTLSVNVSAQNLGDQSFVAYVRNLLQKTGLPPERLLIELTENSLVENAGLTGKILAALQSIGVRIALDDFGTGYSSLSHLHRFPLDIIKIDRSFVKQVENNQRLAQIVRSITYMGQQLGLSITAEGIETKEQLQFLRELGCTFAQGFLFAKPLPGSATADLLRQVPVWSYSGGN